MRKWEKNRGWKKRRITLHQRGGSKQETCCLVTSQWSAGYSKIEGGRELTTLHISKKTGRRIRNKKRKESGMCSAGDKMSQTKSGYKGQF